MFGRLCSDQTSCFLCRLLAQPRSEKAWSSPRRGQARFTVALISVNFVTVAGWWGTSSGVLPVSQTLGFKLPSGPPKALWLKMFGPVFRRFSMEFELRPPQIAEARLATKSARTSTPTSQLQCYFVTEDKSSRQPVFIYLPRGSRSQVN